MACDSAYVGLLPRGRPTPTPGLRPSADLVSCALQPRVAVSVVCRLALLGPPQTRVPSRQVAGRSGPGRSPQARRPAAASVSPRDRRGARLVALPPRPEPRAHGTDRTRWCRSACPPHPRPGPAAGRCRHPALLGCPSSPSSHGAWQSWAVTWGRASFRPAQPVGSQCDEGAMHPSNEA